MVLNYDCIRDILIFLESRSGDTRMGDFMNELNSAYSEEEIMYAIRNLNDIKYIHAKISNYDNVPTLIFCSGITMDGHKYLNAVRNDTVWKKTKEQFSKYIVPITLEGILALATDFISKKFIK